MEDVYKIGPFLISYKLIIIGLSGVFGYLVLLAALKRTEVNRKIILDIVSSCILILILTWKFGRLLFNPKQLLDNPLLILFTTGSNATLVLGFIFSAVYTVYKIYKHGIPRNTILDLASLSILSFMFIYNLFIPVYGFHTQFPWGISLGNENVTYHPINSYFAITIAILMIFLLKFIRTIGNGKLFIKTALVIGISGLVLTFVSPQINYIIGISQKQWMFILLIFAGILAYTAQKKESRLNDRSEEAESKD